MTSVNGLKFRAYRDGDEKGIFELAKTVYPQRKYARNEWLRWWRWAYKENPCGQGIVCLAEHDGKIVGHSAMLLERLKVGDKIILGAQSGSVMTHPDYRGRGIYETLTTNRVTEATNRSVELIYAFPTTVTHFVTTKKMHWFDVAPKRFMVKPLNWRNIVQLKVQNRPLQKILAAGASLLSDEVLFRNHRAVASEGLTIKRITSFDERFDEFWNNISNDYPIMVVRDKDFLNWRYGGAAVGYEFSAKEESCVILAAEKADRIYGYVVLKPEKRKNLLAGLIFDLAARTEQAMRLLTDMAVKYCHQNGMDLVYYPFITTKGTQYRLLKKAGFLSPPFLKVDTYFVTCPVSTSISEEVIKNPDNWFI